MIVRTLTVALLSFALLSPAQADDGKHGVAPAPGQKVFGIAMPAGAAVPLADALKAKMIPETPQKINGDVKEVCQREGCWLVIADGTAYARVRTKEHAFLVPKDLRGKVEVYGVLKEKQNTKAMQEHLAKDDKSAFVTEREFEITAHSVAVLN